MDSLNPTSVSASASSESAQEMGGDGTLSNSSDRSAETARVTGGTDEGDTTMMSSKICFTLSASSQNAASSSVVVIKKKKHIPETFRDQEDGDDAELAKKRRVEALLLQPMEDGSEDTSAHGNTTAAAATTTLAVSDDTVHTHSTTSDDGTTLTDMDAQKTNDTPISMEQHDKSSLLLTQEHDKINQQNGWRVKLYRLNTDGSWDDCGTGRILCISSAKQILQDSSEQHAAGKSNSSSSDPSGISSNAGAWKAFDRIPHTATLTLQQQQRLAVALDEAIHRDLGNPILFMHAEITNMNSTPAAAAVDATHLQYAPRVLLRARVLLWETYQRQGDSIITWCEPAPAETNANTNNTTSQQQQQESPPSHNQSHPAHTSSQDESCSYQGVDLALSFQDNAGCIDIWHNISTAQRRANDLLKSKNGFLYESSDGRRIPFLKTWPTPQRISTVDVIHHNNHSGSHALSTAESSAVPMSQGASNNIQTSLSDNSILQSQSQYTNRLNPLSTHTNHSHAYELDKTPSSAVSMAVAAAAAAYGNFPRTSDNNHAAAQKSIITYHHPPGNINNHTNYSTPLPSPPTFHHLEDIADLLVSAQTMTQREHMAAFLAKTDCAYIHALCSFFPTAEARDDFQALATLASIIKAVVLLNDPDIIECIVSDEQLFEKCCCCLEYDPDLRDKANHRWFIRHRLKFRTVILMEDAELISNIHIAFRVTYLRDTLLRPTMDESCLSTLASLLTFTHTNVLKGVICAPANSTSNESVTSTEYSHDDATDDTRFSPNSYLVRILRLLGTEIKMIRKMEWAMDDNDSYCNAEDIETASDHSQSSSDDDRRKGSKRDTHFAPWEQHLAPQDDSLESRKIRRRGCVSFLRELFVMVRTSLQQSDKDDFYAMIVLLDVYLGDSETVNLLSLMGALLSDPTADISERGICLEILSTIAMHHASLIRQHCLDVFTSSHENKNGEDVTSQMIVIPRPQPNDHRQVFFYSHHNDLLMSLLFVMAVESDAGVMLQTAELMRIIMDTEMINDHSLLGAGILDNEEDELLCGNGSFHGGPQSSGGVHIGSSEQNSFLKMFYDHYVPWLVVPFQYSVYITRRALPFDFILYNKDGSMRKNQKLEKLMCHPSTDFKSISFLRFIPSCSIRASFSIELLSFCVRAHCFRMKFYVIRARVLSHVLKFLRSETKAGHSGERCVKLAALKFLRSILAVKDEFYNRHIIQHNLFAPVFETFRTNPIGDNLVASSIVEMCDFITRENIKSLLEYIVTKHLHQPQIKNTVESSSLETVAMPYVDTLTKLRRQYEGSNHSNYALNDTKDTCSQRLGDDKVPIRTLKLSNERALEDQRKFAEHDEEESYFNDDDT